MNFVGRAYDKILKKFSKTVHLTSANFHMKLTEQGDF